MKAKTLLEGHDGQKKLNEGDIVFVIQGNLVNGGIMVNVDWSFSNESKAKPELIKSMLGGFLGNILDIFGEKMVTEAIIHYAQENGKIETDIHGNKTLKLKSKGLEFKRIK